MSEKFNRVPKAEEAKVEKMEHISALGEIRKNNRECVQAWEDEVDEVEKNMSKSGIPFQKILEDIDISKDLEKLRGNLGDLEWEIEDVVSSHLDDEYLTSIDIDILASLKDSIDDVTILDLSTSISSSKRSYIAHRSLKVLARLVRIVFRRAWQLQNPK